MIDAPLTPWKPPRPIQLCDVSLLSASIDIFYALTMAMDAMLNSGGPTNKENMVVPIRTKPLKINPKA